jgi:hypothetical protein
VNSNQKYIVSQGTHRNRSIGFCETMSVYFNYAPHKFGYFVPVDLLVYRILIDPPPENPPPVLIIGEGNGTFSLALGALRQSMTGIVTTCLENDKQYVMAGVIGECLENHAKNNDIFSKNHVKNNRTFVFDDLYPAKSTEFVGERYQGATFKEADWTRISGVDCRNKETWTNIPQASFQNIFFQCPFVRDPNGHGTQGLLQSFMNTTNQVQTVGHYVFIGITSKFPYVDMYGLGTLPHYENPQDINLKREGTPWAHGNYTFRGIDTQFLKAVLAFGYRHQGIVVIHKDIAKEMAVLVFEKTRPQMDPPVDAAAAAAPPAPVEHK